MTIELKPPLFGSPLITALARHTSTSRSGHVIPGLLLRLYDEIQKRGSVDHPPKTCREIINADFYGDGIISLHRCRS